MSHVFHITCVEKTEINPSKRVTIAEHKRHISYVVGNEGPNVAYLRHIGKIAEHVPCRSKSCVLHGRINNRLQHFVVIARETYCIGVIERIVWLGDFACFLMYCTLVIVIIRQRSGSRIEDGIYLRLGDHCLFGEVTRVALFIRMGVSDAGMTRIILRSVAADQRPAAFEHIRRRGQYRALVPGITAVDRSQPHAHEEHVTHVGHLAGVERIEIQFGK